MRFPHLPAFWPDRKVIAVAPGPPDAWPADHPEPIASAPPGYTPGPFRPARLGGREVPVLLVVGPSPDPVGAALADSAPGHHPETAAAMAAMVRGRIGAPPGLPDPGTAGTGLAPGQTRILLDPCDPALAGAARILLARLRASGLAVLVAREPFADGAPVLPDSLPTAGPPWDPWTLLDAAHTLHGASRDLAMLALAAGVAVADGPLASADPAPTWSALLAATRAADPFHNRPCSIAEGLDLLALWRARQAESGGIAACLGAHPYKRDRLRALLASAGPPPTFTGRASRAVALARRRGGAVLAWSASAPPTLPALCAEAGVPLRWLEDGFIRSAGLGAAFRAGASFAVDSSGPYYDPTTESDLARLLATADFPPALLARATALRQAVVARGVTKYNLGGDAPIIAAPAGQRRILVPGQVEDDASIRLGAGPIRRNFDLLRAVRAAEPDAFLIYKPHPDIEAGFRRGRIAQADLAGLADQVLHRAPMAPLFGLVDAVHTITSLTGFEALLRGLPVTCWGTPFYAGWGLTTDHGPPATPPRTRVLTLDELVAAALILYPRNIDPLTGLPCPPEILLDRMDRPELFPTGRRARLRAVQGFLTRALSRLRGWK
ncbi:capsular biosynthesis protein [Falsiroseomonas sp. HC035]|uniref:capsular polysaccharide export protein, LipB/KpsS family n=1 Tax=Falsiroseomonas sp. HC035 TaxID=3390999 RepID=UPI003D311F23